MWALYSLLNCETTLTIYACRAGTEGAPPRAASEDATLRRCAFANTAAFVYIAE